MRASVVVREEGTIRVACKVDSLGIHIVSRGHVTEDGTEVFQVIHLSGVVGIWIRKSLIIGQFSQIEIRVLHFPAQAKAMQENYQRCRSVLVIARRNL